jgi:membrane-bound serine protease (ClpP class)
MRLIALQTSELNLPLGLIVAVLIPLAVIFFFMTRLALRARTAKITTGEAVIIGLRGRARTEIAPEGTVFVRGELWGARAAMRIAEGESVRVIGLDGLVLKVEAERDNAIALRRA